MPVACLLNALVTTDVPPKVTHIFVSSSTARYMTGYIQLLPHQGHS